MILSFNVNVPRIDRYPTYKRNETYNDINLFRLEEDATTCEIDIGGKEIKNSVIRYQRAIRMFPEFRGIKAVARAGHLYLIKVSE